MSERERPIGASAKSNGASIPLRPVSLADAVAIADIYAPIVSATAISFEERPPDAIEMERRIRALYRTYPWLVAEDGAGIAGYAYASEHRARAGYRWSVDVSVYVAETARQRGVARRLYAALLRVLTAQGFYAAFAGVALPNEASLALHRAAGFFEIGTYRNVGFKAGAWRDVRWCERSLREPARVPAAAPDEPRSFDVLETAFVALLLAND